MTEERQPTDVWPQVDIWPDMGDFRRRFDEIQSEFIEQPRDAVRKAERLVNEAIELMAKTMRDRLHSIRSDTEGITETEQLRLAMRRYRLFIDSLGNRH
jgi:hypothetical protein